MPSQRGPRNWRTRADLLHDLRVHQVELEMQNEALRQTQTALEEARDRYRDPNKFALVGYPTLSAEGIIKEINLTGTTLLGRERKALLHYPFAACVAPADGSITVRARRLEDSPDGVLLRIEVADTGIGIAAEGQKRLFTAYEQADGSMTRKYGGTGLGLAITKRLVQLMGGEIGVESETGQGSTFWFTVRLANPPMPSRQRRLFP